MAECLERPCETGIDLMGTSASVRQDLQRFGAWLGDLRVLLFGLLAVLLSVTLMTAWSGAARAPALRLTGLASYSGDDLYDPAAGSRLALLSQASSARVASFSGDDAYDFAAGAWPERAFYDTPFSFSGDDVYDPAAGGQPALLTRAASYSGDDAYDFAAGAWPERAFYDTPFSFSGDDAYDLAAGGQPALFSQSTSYSGDDAYDPAAGGDPK